MIEQHESHKKPGVNSGTPETYPVPAPLVTHVEEIDKCQSTLHGQKSAKPIGKRKLLCLTSMHLNY